MNGKLLFCHDHWFSFYEGRVYSPGKLDYQKFKFYLDLFDSVDVLGRVRNVTSLSKNDIVADGENVQVTGIRNLSTWRSFFYRNDVAKIIEKKIDECDFVIVRVPSEIGNLAARIARKKNKPYMAEIVVRAYDALFYQNSFFAKLYAPIMEMKTKKVVSYATYALYVTADYLQKYYPNNCKLNDAVSDVSITEVSSAKLLSNKTIYHIGIIGSPDVAVKGVGDAIAAIELVRDSGLDIHFHVLGNHCKYVKKNPLLPKWVHFDGSLPSNQVIDWLDKLDLYLQPSYAEGLPRALIEAMSRGLPCVASSVGGIPELLGSAFLINPGDIASLRNAINELLTDKYMYDNASLSSLDTAKRYVHSVLNDKRIKFYEACISHNANNFLL